MKILVTGTAGFIGYHLARKLLWRGNTVIGLDTINGYYDVNLKYTRLNELGINKNEIEENKLIQSSTNPNHSFIKCDLENAPVKMLLTMQIAFSALFLQLYNQNDLLNLLTLDTGK